MFSCNPMTLEIIVSIVLFLSLMMACVPTLPGIPLMFIVTVVYGLLDKFETIEPWHLAIFGGITVLSMLIDFFSGLIGAKLGGASRKSMLAGFAGLIVGLLAFPPLGAFIGLFVGVFMAEIVQFKDEVKALRAATTSLATAVMGTIANVTLAVAYFITFLILVF